jgi:hypothetical protein
MCDLYFQQINTISIKQTVACRVRCYVFSIGRVTMILKFYAFFLLDEFDSTYPTVAL